MNTNQNLPPKKKGEFLKWAALIFGLVFLFTAVSIWKSIKSIETEKQEAEKNKKDYIARSQKFQKGWEILDILDKKEEMKKLINSNEKFYSEKRFLINNDMITLIKSSVKYPETLEYKSISKDFVKNPYGSTTLFPEDFFNINYDKGTFTVSKEFKSENKLGMKVRGLIFCDFNYNGLNYTLKDIKFE